MSDYLWNLAARALNRATVVRPRIAPLFGAPDPLAPAWPVPELSVDRSPLPLARRGPERPNETDLRADVPVDVPRVAAEVQSEVPPPLPTHEPSPHKPRPVQRESKPQARETHCGVPAEGQRPDLMSPLTRNSPTASVEPGLENPIPFPPIVHKPESLPPIDRQVQLAERPAREETIASLTPEVARPAPATPELTPPSAGKAPPAKAPPEPGMSTAPQRKSLTLAVERPPAIPVVAARAPLRSIPLAASPAATSQPAPTIQVTIGRIEVRATPATQPHRPAAPKQSSSSLEEYLKRRANGGGA